MCAMLISRLMEFLVFLAVVLMLLLVNCVNLLDSHSVDVLSHLFWIENEPIAKGVNECISVNVESLLMCFIRIYSHETEEKIFLGLT